MAGGREFAVIQDLVVNGGTVSQKRELRQEHAQGLWQWQ